MRELDMIFIVGDLFDGPLQHYSDDAIEVQLWLFELLTICEKYDISLRILEGTRSHDWKQNVWATVVKTISRSNVDLKWVSTLSIERIEKFGIDVLYVPDEWRSETDQTWLEVNQLMSERSLDQVDFTLLHGAFDKQMPEFVDCPKHVADRYSEITRYKVFAGHIHESWVYKNILGNGSFDRLVHGDEGKKGFWKVSFRDGEDKVRFIVNDGAMVYRTIVCDGLEIDKALLKIDKEIAQLPEGSHIRIQAKNKDAIIQSLDLLKKKHKQFIWSTKTSDSKVAQAKLLIDHRPANKHVPITEDNIGELLVERLTLQNVDPQLMLECKRNLLEMGYSLP